MHKKHILFILEYFSPHIGGVETLFTKIVEGVLREGHEVSIVTSRYNAMLPEVENYAERCTVYRVGHNRFDFIRFGLRKANQLCHTGKIDLIHATTFMAALPAGILRALTGIPTVLHVHEIYGKLWYRFLGPIGFFSRILEDIIFRLLRFDRYICVSNYTKNNLRIMYGIPDRQLLTVYNAIDYEFWNNSEFKEQNSTGNQEINTWREHYNIGEKKVVLFFGRPGVAKGLEDLLQAIPRVLAHHSDVHFVLIVPQDTKKKVGFIRSTINENDYDSIIQTHSASITQIPGTQGDVLKGRIQTADLIVLPSHAEGFGFAIAEVCAMGKPLITTNVAAIPEVVSGEIMFVEPGNPEQIADTIHRYFTGTADITSIPPKIFTREDCITKVLQVYQKLLERNTKV